MNWRADTGNLVGKRLAMFSSELLDPRPQDVLTNIQIALDPRERNTPAPPSRRPLNLTVPISPVASFTRAPASVVVEAAQQEAS